MTFTFFDSKPYFLLYVSFISVIEWAIAPEGKLHYDNKKAIVIPCRAMDKDVITKAFRVKENGDLQKLPASAVILHRPKAADSGKYLCTAERNGQKSLKEFELIVRGKKKHKMINF